MFPLASAMYKAVSWGKVFGRGRMAVKGQESHRSSQSPGKTTWKVINSQDSGMSAPEMGLSGQPQGYRHKLSLYHYRDAFVPFFCSCCCPICVHPHSFCLPITVFSCLLLILGSQWPPLLTGLPLPATFGCLFSFSVFYCVTSPSLSLLFGSWSHRTDCPH